MQTVAAFLRGINLGRRRLGMDELRGHLEAMGLARVATFLASGNVVFDRAGGEDPASDLAALERRVETHLAGALGYEVRTFLRPLPELTDLLEASVLGGAEEAGFRPHVVFLRSPPTGEVEAALAGLDAPDDRFRVLGRQVVWLRRGRLTDSPISVGDLDRALQGRDHTMRNLNTVRRLVAKFGAGGVGRGE